MTSPFVAGAEQKYTGLGALRKGANGEVVMEELNSSIARDKVIRVQLMRKGCITGISTIADNENIGSITASIEKARDLVYEHELFLEMVREARMLANLGVRTSKDCVIIDFGGDTHALIELVCLHNMISHNS